MKKLRVAVAALLGVAVGLHLAVIPAGASGCVPSISKQLTSNQTVPQNLLCIPQKAEAPTTYHVTISYVSCGGLAVTLIDTIPAEFDTVAVTQEAGSCDTLEVKKLGKKETGATKITCPLDAGESAVLQVTFQTRQSPGQGHDPAIFKPTSCGLDGTLRLNDGAVAVDATGAIVLGPTNPLTVNIDECGTCSVCGDGTCDAASGENASNCATDCGCAANSGAACDVPDQRTPGGCFCDSLCSTSNDCCPDVCVVCTSLPECSNGF